MKTTNPNTFIYLCLLTVSVFDGIDVKAQCQVNFDEVIKAVAADRAVDDRFGWSVSISGDRAIVGAFSEDHDASGGNTQNKAGSAYIFERDNSGNWTQAQKIVASDRAADDWFGWSVSISGDRAIVGAYREDEDPSGGKSSSDAGSAYIFERDGSGNWTQAQKIVASDRAADDWFGYSVSISGGQAIVGASGEDHDASGGNIKSRAGSAYIFERDGSGNWTQAQKIVAPDRAAFDLFGASVSISGDHAIVGAFREDEDASGINPRTDAGSAYIFERDGLGNWSQTQKIVVADPSDRNFLDFFGGSVSISGGHAIVGASGDDQDASGGNIKSRAGSAYIFERDGSGNWIQAQKLVAPDRAALDLFGASVSISGDRAIVGALREDEDPSGGNTSSDAGSAYIFERDGSDNWTHAQKIVASDRGADDWFGKSVSISGDHAIVGASGGNPSSDTGSAYISELVNCCSFPTNLSSSISGSTAHLSWDAVPGANTYILRGGLLGGSFIQIPITDSALSVPNLLVGDYNWQIASICAAGDTSMFSSIDTFTVTPACDSAPQNLHVVNLTSSSATLQWDAVSQAVNYVIRGSAGSFDKTGLIFLTSPVNSKSLGDLVSGVSYFWQVQAVCNSTVNPVTPFSVVNSFTTLNQSQKNGSIQAVEVYPNPFSDYTYMESIHAPIEEIVVTSMDGREILRDKPNAYKYKLERRDMVTGVYVVKLIIDGEGFAERVLVIQ